MSVLSERTLHTSLVHRLTHVIHTLHIVYADDIDLDLQELSVWPEGPTSKEAIV